MELPSDLLLHKITESHLYLDKQSLEERTGKIKSKYKLARSKILEQYLFHILTKSKSSCKDSSTLKLRREDWENITNEDFLSEELSYCDITKYHIHGEASLLEKIKNPQNGFPLVAKLMRSKYIQLLKLCKKVRYNPYVSNAVKEVIASQSMIEERLKILGLD